MEQFTDRAYLCELKAEIDKQFTNTDKRPNGIKGAGVGGYKYMQWPVGAIQKYSSIGYNAAAGERTWKKYIIIIFLLTMSKCYDIL